MSATKVRVNGVDYIVFAYGYQNGYVNSIDIVSFDGEKVNVIPTTDTAMSNTKACTLKCGSAEYALI